MKKIFGHFAGITAFAAMMWFGVGSVNACTSYYGVDCTAVEGCTWNSKSKRCTGTPTAPAAEIEYGTNAHVDLCAAKKTQGSCENPNSNKCAWNSSDGKCTPECLMLDDSQCELSEVKLIDKP